jgi:hypothetical protein
MNSLKMASPSSPIRVSVPLVHADGKTYAFSNQWGGELWLKAMTRLKEKYPQFKIEFSTAW